MYEELIAKLRYCNSAATCRDCPYTYGACDDMKKEAADAIDELSRQLKDLECINIGDLDCDEHQLCTCMGIVRNRLEAKKPRWISVEERLPEDDTGVLIAYKDIFGEPAIGQAIIRSFGWCWFEGCVEDSVVEVRVEITHWMPLPELPKEG